MIIEEVASVGNVFWVLRIGMKKNFHSNWLREMHFSGHKKE